MIRRRHPIVAAQLAEQPEGHLQTSFLLAAADARMQLAGVMRFEPEPGTTRRGWQHEAC